MSAQPPDNQRTSEIDLSGIVDQAVGRAIDRTAADEVSAFAPVDRGTNLLHGHHALRISWFDWSSIAFAALTVVAGVLAILYFLESPETHRISRAREPEYLYRPPTDAVRERAEIDAQPRPGLTGAVQDALSHVNDRTAAGRSSRTSATLSPVDPLAHSADRGSIANSSDRFGSRELRTASSASSQVSRTSQSGTRQNRSPSRAMRTGRHLARSAHAATLARTKPCGIAQNRSKGLAAAGGLVPVTRTGATILKGSGLNLMDLSRQTLIRSGLRMDRDAADRH